jgi:hypothetical protein
LLNLLSEKENNIFAIGNDELEKCEPLGDFIFCNRCSKRHIIRYGKGVLPDGTEKLDKLLAFVKCDDDKTFLVGINGKKVNNP